MTESTALTAMVFPGMGPSDFAEVGKFMLINSIAKGLLAEADNVVGYSILDGFRSGQSDYSEAAQLAFLVNCTALAQWAEAELDVRPQVCTGASFGERAAAAYARALPFADAVTLTAGLSRCISEYFESHHQDVVTQSFARAPHEGLDRILKELDELGEWYEFSCYLDDGIFMISLRERNLEWFQKRLRSIGALPMYVMQPPLHTAILHELRTRAEDRVLGACTLEDPALPIVSDLDGSLVTTAEEVRCLLLDGFVRAVRWPDTMKALLGYGVSTVCVAGPDRLFGRVDCVLSNFDVVAATPTMAIRHGNP
jgi:[acyl-carrier-protein] S-malonyltransferase